MDLEINKGIGRNVEFKGLESQYLFIFCCGLLAVFVVFVILYIAGVNQWVCIGFGAVSATFLVWLTFRLNERYGTHGGSRPKAASEIRTEPPEISPVIHL